MNMKSKLLFSLLILSSIKYTEALSGFGGGVIPVFHSPSYENAPPNFDLPNPTQAGWLQKKRIRKLFAQELNANAQEQLTTQPWRELIRTATPTNPCQLVAVTENEVDDMILPKKYLLLEWNQFKRCYAQNPRIQNSFKSVHRFQAKSSDGTIEPSPLTQDEMQGIRQDRMKALREKRTKKPSPLTQDEMQGIQRNEMKELKDKMQVLRLFAKKPVK